MKNSNLMLNILCDKLGIRFFKEMLNWPKGKRESDGIWGRHWYGSVEASSGFHSYIEKTGNLPSKNHDIFEVCLESYQQLNSHQIIKTPISRVPSPFK